MSLEQVFIPIAKCKGSDWSSECIFETTAVVVEESHWLIYHHAETVQALSRQSEWE